MTADVWEDVYWCVVIALMLQSEGELSDSQIIQLIDKATAIALPFVHHSHVQQFKLFFFFLIIMLNPCHPSLTNPCPRSNPNLVFLLLLALGSNLHPQPLPLTLTPQALP